MSVYRKESEVFLSQTVRFVLLNLTVACFIFGIGASSAFAQIDAEKLKAATVTPEALSASFAEVSKSVEAAVVNIDTKGKIPVDVTLKDEKPETNNTPDSVMELYRRMLPRRPSSAVGSGFILDKAGYILTNFHVIEDASRITVKLTSSEEFTAKVIGFDKETDLAILKIEAGRDLPFVKFGDSDQARVGDWVLAIGSPFGLAQTVTAGIVSQTKRETPYSQFQKFIQTDAAINRGNSGGPLVNMSGEVIGINSQIATSTGDYNGIGFALPSNDAANVYRQIRENGQVRRGYFGVNLESVKAEFAKVYGLPEAKGAIITNINDKKSAAALAGLQTGDIILEFNGSQILSAPDLVAKIASTTPEKEVSVTYLREAGSNLERKTALIKLAERPSTNTIVEEESTSRKLPVSDTKKPVEPFGLTLIELTPQLAAVYKVEGEKGLIIKNINQTSFISDVKTSNGAEAISEGDLIQRINRTAVTDLKTFNETVNRLKKGDAVVLQVQSYDLRTRSLQRRIVQFTVQ